MKANGIRTGDFIISLAGRDRGRVFVVISSEDGFAYIADGMLRSIVKPKKKKLRHLRALQTPPYTGEFADKALRGAVKAVSVD